MRPALCHIWIEAAQNVQMVIDHAKATYGNREIGRQQFKTDTYAKHGLGFGFICGLWAGYSRIEMAKNVAT